MTTLDNDKYFIKHKIDTVIHWKIYYNRISAEKNIYKITSINLCLETINEVKTRLESI